MKVKRICSYGGVQVWGLGYERETLMTTAHCIEITPRSIHSP